MRVDRIQQELEYRPTLLGAAGDHGPNALAPAPAFFTARPLGDPSIDHHEANCLFGQVVRRPDARRGNEAKIGFSVPAKPLVRER
jgi:hypothetical protein